MNGGISRGDGSPYPPMPARAKTVRAVLGIDLGTSGVKVLVADLAGRLLGRGMAGYPVRVPGGGQAETDPGDWWLATRTAVRRAMAEAGHVTVTALAVAGQMHGLVLADAAGTPLRPAILWLDQRAAAEAATYAELPRDYTAVLGSRPSPGMAGPLLSWLMTREPCTVRASWWALQPKDWLRLRLTGQAATDPTDASGTLLFDLARGTWAEPLIEKLGLPREKLPPVADSAAIAGRLRPGPAADLGLPPGIPVAVGAADTAAALFAAGLRPDEAMLNLGSGGQWVASESGFRPAAATNLYRAVGGGYYRLAPVQNVGITLDWVRDLLGATWDELYGTAARPRRADAPRFDPHLVPERWSPGATAAWTGLTLAHQREDLMRSALDGVAGLLRQRLDDLRAAGCAPSRVVLGGGGTRNPAWRALLEETLDLPLRHAATTWLTPAGAARLAAEALQSLGSPTS
ncbi:MAG TPA: FGGY family carbohydrate kinase [Trebonia sp.]|nr:FGGY family carbohydrate kinase [Trebonia sp.]